MADLVGDAYVRIHADTKFMADAIERDMKKLGKKGADSLLANFDKTLKSSAKTRLRSAQLTLADAITGGDFDSMLRKSNLSVSDFVDQIIDDLGRLESNPKIKFKGLDDALDSLDEWAQRASVREEADRMAVAFDRDWKAAQRLNATFREQERIGASLAAHFEDLDTSAWRTEVRKLTADIKATNDEFDRLEAEAAAAAAALRDSDGVESHRTFSRTRNAIILLNKDLDRFAAADGLGRIFGKGSRNDFVNAIGATVGNITAIGEALVRLPFRALQMLANGLGGLVDNFKDLRAAGMSVPGILLRGLGGAVAFLIPAVIALVTALGTLSVVLPAVVSLASALLGGLTAAAGALYFAIAGTLLPLVPILAAVGVGLAPLALGIAGITKAINDKSKSVKGLVADWKAFQRATQPFVREFTQEVALFGDELGGIVPFVNDLGDALLSVMRHLRQLFNDPAMDPFIDAWRTTMPIIFENVGRALNTLLAALTAFFAPILPFAERLSAKFEDLANTFLAWSTSPGGQNAIKDFMTDAWDAASLLWNILGDVVVALHNLFDIGQEEAGGSLLEYIERLTERFKQFTEAPEGRESIAEWFGRAKVAGEQLFAIVGQIFTFFASLDTEQAATDLNNFLSAMRQVGDYAESFAAALGRISDAVHLTWAAVSGPGEFIPAVFERWPARISEAIDSVRTTVGGLPIFLQSTLVSVPVIVTNALFNMPNLMGLPFSRGVAAAINSIDDLPGQVSRIIGSVPGIIALGLAGVLAAMASPFGRAIDNVALLLRTGPTVILLAMAGWVGAAASAVRGVVGTITGPFQSALDTVRNILSQIREYASQAPGILGGLAGLIPNAAGSIVTGPTAILAGEAGREAIVPLDRPLSMIDPSVRALAAFAQGKMGSQSVTGGKQITVMPGAINVSVPNTNPYLAAESVLDRMVSLIGT